MHRVLRPRHHDAPFAPGVLLTASVAVLTALLLLAGAGPAAAQTLSKADPVGDVVDSETNPAPQRTLGDIRRSIIRHTDNKIVLRANYARLDIKKRQPFSARWFLDADGSSISVRVDAQPGSWSGVLTVDATTPLRPHRAAACQAHKVNYRKNFVRVTLLRDCFSHPRWVKVATYTEFDAGDTVFVDDGLQDGFIAGFRISRKVWST